MLSPQLICERNKFIFGSGNQDEVVFAGCERASKDLSQARRGACNEGIARTLILRIGRRTLVGV